MDVGKEHFKELVHIFVETRQIQNLLEWSRRLETQGRASQRQSAGRLLLSWRRPFFALVRPSN